MAWYTGTYSCGHDGRTNIIGPQSNRDWIYDKHFSGVCPECYEKKLEEDRKKTNELAIEKAKEMELPELNGTEKQVAWANTLRIKLIKIIDSLENNELKYIKLSESDKFIILDYIMSQTKASFFIDNRLEGTLDFCEKIINLAKEHQKKLIDSKDIQILDIKQESTVYPENKISNAVVEIIIMPNKIKVNFEKNEKFIEIVKSLNFKWDGEWLRTINEFTGSADDRAAELGNKLLNAGFPIMITDSIVRQNAIEGKFNKECTRWIITKENELNKLIIKWQGRNDKLYKVARSLPGSKWSDGVVVNIAHLKEIEEFAKLYDFNFTKKALLEIEKEKSKFKTVVSPILIENIKQADGLKEILKSSDEVLDELKDI